MGRQAEVERQTKETSIRVAIDLDGTGRWEIDTGIPFMDHMLSFLSTHGFMDIRVVARGDREIDDHHTVEDLGICFGLALKKAIGEEKRGIRRYGEATVPMDEALARVVLDFSNRAFLAYRVPAMNRPGGAFDVGLIKEFFRALTINAGMTVHVDLFAGEDPHHVSEAVFKALARALDAAGKEEARLEGKAPSTKGLL